MKMSTWGETIRHAMFSSETIFPLVIQRVAFLTCQEQGYSKESFVTLSLPSRLLRNGPQEIGIFPKKFSCWEEEMARTLVPTREIAVSEKEILLF